MSAGVADLMARPLSALCVNCGHQDSRHRVLEASCNEKWELHVKVECNGTWRGSCVANKGKPCDSFVIEERAF